MIRAFTGRLGSGKSYSLVNFLLSEVKKRQCQVYTNMAGLRCPEAVYIEALEDLPKISHGIVALDETGVFLSSRNWQSLPKSTLTSFAMARKNGLDLYWTAHALERVDTILRELTGEEVRCQRFGRFIRQTVTDTGKDILGKRAIPLLPSMYRIYDTYERIDEQGASSGLGQAAPPEHLSTLARRRYADDKRRREAQRQAASVPLFVPSFLGSGNVIRLRKEAFEAGEYLRSVGGWSDAMPWPDQVRREMLRRDWMKQWGLKPDDAPYYCTFENPWLKGFSPAMVEQRNADKKEADALAFAAEQAGKRSRSNGRGGNPYAHAS